MKKLLCASVLLLLFLTPALSLAATVTGQTEPYQIQETGGLVSRGRDTTGAAYDIDISKTISRAGDDPENFFDVTLTVRTHVHPKPQISTDVVLVMDVSNTMNYRMSSNDKPRAGESSRLALAKEAAKTFVDEFAGNTNLDVRNLGVVAFNTSAATVSPMTDMTVSANVSAVKNAIGSVMTSTDGSAQRFTNIEGGLLLARNLLAGSTATYKYVVLITDGFPTTYSQNAGSTSKTAIPGYEPFTAATTPYTEKDGFFAYTLDGRNNIRRALYGTNYSNKGAVKARNVAQSLKNAGVNIFSIGVALGAQSIGDFDKFTVDTVGMSGSAYEIGANTAAYKNWLRTKIAGGKDVSASGRTTYFDATSKKQLQDDMHQVFLSIDVQPQLDSRQFFTLDPMSEDVEFIGFYDKNGRLASASASDAQGTVSSSLTGLSRAGAENTVSFIRGSTTVKVPQNGSLANYTNDGLINWNLLKSGFTSEVVGGVTYYNFSLRYRVRLKNEAFAASEFSSGANGGAATDKPANETTRLYWETFNRGTGELIGSGSMEYPIPAVEGYKGELAFTKLGASGDPLSGASFQLIHRAVDCPICEGEAVISTYTASSDADGRVSFSNIPSGHHYVLHENVPPTGYARVHDHGVIVSYGKTYIQQGSQNKLLEDGVFTADNAPFTLVDQTATPVSLQFTMKKTLSGSAPGRSFSFRMTGTTQHGSPFSATASSDSSGLITFPELTFDSEGDYIFTLTEVTGEDETIVYDADSFHVKVSAAHHIEGAADDWHASVSLSTDGTNYTSIGSYTGNVSGTTQPADAYVLDLTSLQSAAFDNALRPLGALSLSASKQLKDANGRPLTLPANKFAYELMQLDANGDPMGDPLQIKTNDANGLITFDAIAYNASGEYFYTIRELSSSGSVNVPRDSDFFYDPSIWDVKVTVTVPQSLTDSSPFSAEAVYTLRSGSGTTGADGKPVFTNLLKRPASLTVRALKTLDGEIPKKDAFRFELLRTDENHNVLEVLETVANDEKGVIAFAPLSYLPTEDGETTPHGLHHYLLREVVPDTPAKNTIYDPAIYYLEVLLADENALAYHADVAIYRLLSDGTQTLVATYEAQDVILSLTDDRTLTFANTTYSGLPETGDSSRLALWLLALAACCAGGLLLYRRRSA